LFDRCKVSNANGIGFMASHPVRNTVMKHKRKNRPQFSGRRLRIASLIMSKLSFV
jgi:hypothetical protein